MLGFFEIFVHRFPQKTLIEELLSEGFLMQPVDFFRSRIDAMINLNDPLAVLATRLPWS